MTIDTETPVAATAPEQPGRQTIKLTKPVKYEGIERAELVLDLDGLTGDDMIAAQTAMMLEGQVPVMLDTDRRYHFQLAAKAAGVPVELLGKLCLRDATAVAMAVQGFTMG